MENAMNFDLIGYCNEKLWLTRSRDLPWWKRIPVNTVRVIILTARRFIQNQCTLKASALTFYTLFSIVPVLALIFGIAKGFGLEKMLEQKIHSVASDYPSMAEKIINFADTMLRNAKGGLVAGIGVLLLIWSAIKLMGSIEANLNEIWGVKQGRTLI
ncbi:MAG: YihY/virulence factor BrkB family protein, partial [Lentisphaeria bacterium]|nr:YihY/virulence factor BrkB family protein [Lentisphaeria bacterium]